MSGAPEPVRFIRTHLRLPYQLSAGATQSRFFDGIRRGEIYGRRCDRCGQVYVPARPCCPQCWKAMDGWVRVSDTGTLATFVVVNVPFYGQEIEIPYILANVQLDGADNTFKHLLGTKDADGKLRAVSDAHIGMRIGAVWRPPSARTGFLTEDIDHFAPVDEPAAAPPDR